MFLKNHKKGDQSFFVKGVRMGGGGGGGSEGSRIRGGGWGGGGGGVGSKVS